MRERDWCNVITAHQGSPAAYTWLLKNYTLGNLLLVCWPKMHSTHTVSEGGQPTVKALGQFFSNAAGEHVLQPPRAPGSGTADAPVSCVSISSCGNFGLVGTSAGRVDRYNMQSGLHRGTYSR